LISYVGESAITEQHVADVLGVADRSLTRTLVRALAGGEAGTALSAVESAIERGVDEVQLARAIVRYLRDLSVLQVAPERPELVDATDEERKELASEAGALDRSRVTQMFDRMLRCCDELGKTLQPRLVLDCALIDVATVEPLVPLGDLIERLGELEHRIASGGGGMKSTGARAPARASAPPSAAPRATTPAAQPPSRTSTPRAEKPAFAVGTAPGAEKAPVMAVPQPGPVKPPERSEKPTKPDRPGGPSERDRPGPGLDRPGPDRPGPDRPGPDRPDRPSDKSQPVSMQPSGPVPKAEAVASGSGPKAVREIPSSPSDVLAAWGHALVEVERLSITTHGAYEHARVLAWTKDKLELGFAPRFEMIAEVAEEKDKLDVLRRVLQTHFNCSPKVSVRVLSEAEVESMPARSVLETQREKATAERSKRESEAREHPITKHVIQTFGGHIKEIKTDV
jgi:DNA polymerase-3 subunit gamma/tau